MDSSYPGHDELLALLDGLLVGAGQLMESPGDWAERLGGDGASPLVARFIDQLDAEWHDTWPPDRLCIQVAGQVRARMAAWHPGWPHLWAHVLRVAGLTVALAEDAGLAPAPAYLTGMCHDVAKLDELRTSLPHEEEGANFAADVLRGHLPGAQISAIQAAIRKDGDDSAGAHPQRRRQAGQDRGGGGGAPRLDGDGSRLAAGGVGARRRRRRALPTDALRPQPGAGPRQTRVRGLVRARRRGRAVVVSVRWRVRSEES
ncbi:MAG: HD domain-containing protein [Anaerolineae bacterium]|nr:HD domain-containing protein [Anaerolineae bacterium]